MNLVDLNGQIEFVLIGKNGAEVPMVGTFEMLQSLTKSNPDFKYRLVGNSARAVAKYYYSESKNEFVEIVHMNDNYLFNAIRKKVRNAMGALGNDLTAMQMIVNNSYCLSDPEFIALMKELKDRYPALFAN